MQGISWTGACLSLTFLLLRLVSRLRAYPRRLYLDDWLAIFAWILVFITTALWQWKAADMYYILDVSAGLATVDAEFFSRIVPFARMQLVVNLFFYTTLVAIKFSFLFFFRRLSQRVHGQQYVWWSVMLLTVASYLVSVGDIEYECELGSAETLVTYCNSAAATTFTTDTLKANCALDVLSDFLSTLKLSLTRALTSRHRRTTDSSPYQSCCYPSLYFTRYGYPGGRKLLW